MELPHLPKATLRSLVQKARSMCKFLSTGSTEIQTHPGPGMYLLLRIIIVWLRNLFHMLFLKRFMTFLQ